MIKARDPHLHRISVAVPSFLLPEGVPIPEGTFSTQIIQESDLLIQSIPKGIPRADLPFQHTAGASSTSKPTDKEEVVKVLEFEDEFEAFNWPLSPEALSPDLDPPFSPLLDKIGIQRKPKSSLMDLIESQSGRNAPVKTAQTKCPTPPLGLPLLPGPAGLKRKRESKGKEVVDASKSLPPQEDEAQRVAKQAKVG